MSTEATTVEEVELDLEAILNGAENIVLPVNEEVKKPGFFEPKKTDLSFIDKPIIEKKEEIKEELDAEDNPIVKASVILDEILNENEEEKKTGRAKLDKSGLIELTNKLIAEKLLIPFDDDKKLEDYTAQDFEELYKTNDLEKQKRIREEVPAEFFSALPQELQYAAKYVSDGGRDMKGLFRALAGVEEVKSLDPKNPEHHKSIVRSYLQATQPDWSPEEIEEEITNWDDHNELEAKALKFQPKLEALSEKQVQYKVIQAAKLKEHQQIQAQAYMDDVYKTLLPGELNGLKLDKKTQNMLFAGLLQTDKTFANGQPTNLLGHLLEKYQRVEPNHALVAEALWLLADPEGYKTKVREVTKKEVTAETLRKLKQEESSKIASNATDNEEEDKFKKKGTIPRPNKNFFERKF